MNWVLANNRYDDLKKVLDTVIRWLERVVIYDVATGKGGSILVDVSNDGAFSFLVKYMSKFNHVPQNRYAVHS